MLRIEDSLIRQENRELLMWTQVRYWVQTFAIGVQSRKIKQCQRKENKEYMEIVNLEYKLNYILLCQNLPNFCPILAHVSLERAVTVLRSCCFQCVCHQDHIGIFICLLQFSKEILMNLDPVV